MAISLQSAYTGESVLPLELWIEEVLQENDEFTERYRFRSDKVIGKLNLLNCFEINGEKEYEKHLGN